MFALHTANRTEDLFRRLTVVLDHYHYGPFDPVRFLIHGRGMERWLQMELARVWGAAAHCRFDFPQRFFAELARDLGLRLDDAAFERSRLTWLIDELLDQEAFRNDPQLGRYLAGPGPRLRRFQLARRLAQLFDQYQIQRRDWLSAWAAGRSAGVTGMDREVERWQAALWRRLYTRLGGHRGELWQGLIDALRDPPQGVRFPPAVHLFGISFLPPLMMEVLAALAAHSDIHLYLLTPTEGYWADLPGKRRQALARIEGEEAGTTVPGPHPLLVALGRRGAQFQHLTLECLEPALESSGFFRHRPPTTLLQHVQNDLADGALSPPPPGLAPGFELHRCHTPLREVEVARDRILAALAADPALRLEDIAVMAPDIGVYQPYLEAVFTDLPHHIADRSLGRSNPLLEVLVAALELLAGRFEWETVLELLGRPPVRERFGLTAPQLPLLERWVRDCAIRWGLDGRQRESLGLPPHEYNTWQSGVDRMILGWMADGDEAWRGVVPFSEVEGQMGAALLSLADFVRTLRCFWQRWQQPLALPQWRRELVEFVDALFADTAETLAGRQALERLLETLPEPEDYRTPVALEVIIDWLRSQVEEAVSDDFLSGGITCCTLLPMRSVPFRLTVVLGLEEGAFPRRETPPAFDLLSAHPRLGDRDLRLEQRYQFLELLLSTRDRLILTYPGLTPEKNETLAPAQVVSELIDTLDQYGIERNRWIFDHPPHPFHPDYFRRDSPLSVPDPDRFPVALALRGDGHPRCFWPSDFALDGEPAEALDFSELFDFYRDAQGWFCSRRLQLGRIERDALPEPREPFDVDGLEAWRMRCRILKALQAQENPEALLQRAQSAGEWPQGEAGRQCFERERRLARLLLEAADGCDAGDPDEPCWHEVEVAGLRLYGNLDNRHRRGGLLVEAGRLKGGYLFRAWLYHLLAQSRQPAPTWLVCLAEKKDADEPVVVQRFDPCEDWRDRLIPWVAHFRGHWGKPSPWLPEWGWHWMTLQRPSARGKTLSPDEMTARWCRKCLETRLPESFVLLFGDDLTEDWIAGLVPGYRELLSRVPWPG